MERIDLEPWCLTVANYHRDPHIEIAIAQGINEIMDYLEQHGPVKNGKLFTCVNCQHATAYLGDLGKCCENPLYEVSG